MFGGEEDPQRWTFIRIRIVIEGNESITETYKRFVVNTQQTRGICLNFEHIFKQLGTAS
jgi:hypothetical protein